MAENKILQSDCVYTNKFLLYFDLEVINVHLENSIQCLSSVENSNCTNSALADELLLVCQDILKSQKCLSELRDLLFTYHSDNESDSDIDMEQLLKSVQGDSNPDSKPVHSSVNNSGSSHVTNRFQSKNDNTSPFICIDPVDI